LRRTFHYLLQMVAAGIGLIALTACFHLPTFTPTPSPTAPVTPATQTPFPTPLLISSSTPSPTPPFEPKTVTIGKPAWIGRGGMVDAVFLPGNKQVAIAWGAGVSVDDAASGQEAWFRPTSTNLLAFDVQPGGKQFAAALADGSILIYDAAGGDPRPIQAGAPNAEAGDVAWSPDGKTLAFQFTGAGRGDPISLLDVSSGTITRVPGSTIDSSVTPSLAWSPDGEVLTVATLGDACPHAIDVHSGAPLAQAPASGPLFSSFPQLWLPHSELLAVGSPDGGVAILRFPECNQAGYLWSSTRVDAYPGVKRSLFLDPSGTRLAARGGAQPSGDDTVQPFIVWNLADESVLATLEKPLPDLAHRRRVAAAFDGNTILTLYESGEITRWNVANPAAPETLISRVDTIPVSPAGLVWSADGSRFAISGSYGGVEVWDPASAQLVRRFDPPLELPAFNADGHKIALFDPGKGQETIFDVASGGALRSLDASAVALGPAFSPDGRYLAYALSGKMLLADLSSTRIITLRPDAGDGLAPDALPARLAWSPDSLALVAAYGVPDSEDVGSGLLVLWQIDASGAFLERLHVPNVQVSDGASVPSPVIFNRSGSRVALLSLIEMGTGQMQTVVYDLAQHKTIRALDRYTPGAWAGDDELLAMNGNSSLERINVITGIHTSGGGSGGVDAYAPGGIFTLRQAASYPRGLLVLHWQENPSTHIAGRAAFDAPGIAASGWSPDGGWIWVVGTDGTARIWPVQ